MQCIYCGKEHPDKTVFCPSTGQPLLKLCPYCNQQHPVSMQFCPNTGKPLPLQLQRHQYLIAHQSGLLIPVAILLVLLVVVASVWVIRNNSAPVSDGNSTNLPANQLSTSSAATNFDSAPTPTIEFSQTPTPFLSPTSDAAFTRAALATQLQSTQMALTLSTPDIVLQDDFSSSQWGTATDRDSSIEYANKALQVILFTKNYFAWSTPNDQNYYNIHMEVTVTNNHTDPTTAFGLICDQQTTKNSFYYFAITPAGQYAIAKAVGGQKDLFLTNNNQWQYSDLIEANAASYRMGVDCGNSMLTLYVNGREIDSVSDLTYNRGGVAIFTWSGKDIASANVTFDDFLLTALK